MQQLTKFSRISAPLQRQYAISQIQTLASALALASRQILPQHTFSNNSRRYITPSRAMASDQAYLDFLNKANQDPSAGYGAQGAATDGSARAFKTQDEGSEIPIAIVKATSGADLFYTSDADEPFVPVALRWADKGSSGLPDEDGFARLIQHWDPSKADVQILDPMDWDRHGQYADLLEAVRQAVEGNDVRVYRVARDGTRVEYWLVGREDGSGGVRIVGAKALAVES